ncbi:MAG: proteasome-type protease [Betaproteobacteria bacterium]|nr:proteasome-type protease [Rhodocyclales bacterium]
MTYCVATMIDAGIVFASDSRTNAGVDNISTFRKMKTFERPGDRSLVMVNSGNLAVTQATINHLEQAIRRNIEPNLMSVYSMYDVAELVGLALREVRHRDGPFLMENNVDGSANFIVGGQIAGENPRLFLVYSEGNFIEATPETPYFQIGEVKYGKPIIDRVITADTSMDDAIKCVLVSFDSTMRSNLSVGMPIDLACYERNSLHLGHCLRFDEHDPYMLRLRQSWGEGVRRAFAQLPNLDRP